MFLKQHFAPASVKKLFCANSEEKEKTKKDKISEKDLGEFIHKGTFVKCYDFKDNNSAATVISNGNTLRERFKFVTF